MLPYLFVQELIPNSRNYRTAVAYYHRDLVSWLKVTEESYGYCVNGSVEVYDMDFQCEIMLDAQGHLLNYDCECDYCTDKSPCAHIGAILLKLNELDLPYFPYSYQRENWAEQFLKERENYRISQELNYTKTFLKQKKAKYVQQLSGELQLAKYHLYPLLISRGEGEFSLEYRIGNDRTYVVRSISALLDNIDEQNEVSYGKKLQFIHRLEAFSDQAQKQIAFMREALRFEEYRRAQQTHYYFGYYQDVRLGRYIELAPQLYESFFTACVGQTFKELSLAHRDHYEMEVEEKEDYYTLHFLSPNGVGCIGEQHYYSMEQTGENHFTLFAYPLDDKHNVEELLSTFLEHEVMVSKDHFAEFYKYVLKPIEKYLIIHHLPELINNPYEQIRIYGDVNENGQVEFQLYYEDEDKNRVFGFDDSFDHTYEQDLVEQSFRLYTDRIDNKKGMAYFDMNDENTYAFIHERLPILQDYAEIYVSEALKKVGQPVHYQIQVGIRVNNDLISVDINSVDIPKMEVAEVLAQYRRKKKFHRLRTGELISLDSPELEELSHMMARYHVDTKDIVQGEFQLDQNRMFALDQEAEQESLIKVNRAESFKDLIQRFEQPVEPFLLAEHYDHLLRDYQKEGYQWLRTLHQYGFNGILADDMGLGKTLQVICLLDHVDRQDPSIVICPSSLIYNWEDEVRRFAEHLQPLCIVGDQVQRQSLIKGDLKGKLLITSYDYMRRDIEYYQDLSFQYAILDESQYIKNQNTKNARAVKQLQAKHKLALSGTPIENSLAELWSVFDFLMPQYLFNYHYFRQEFELPIVKNHDEGKIAILRQMVSPFILRRNKKEVLTELPEKIEIKQLIPFSESERELYYASLSQVNEQLQILLNAPVHLDKMAILALLTRLREICCEPRLLYDNIQQPSSKMKACLDLVTNYKQNGQKVLIFSSFTSLFELMEPELHRNGISYLKLTGQTSKEKRREAVNAFQEGKADVFLISLKAGGTGLNLTRAEAVIHFDPWWNQSSQNQATDRAYRIGQTQNVQVHQLIMKESVEEKMMRLQEKKKELADLFVENSEGNIGSLSKEEIMELFAR